MFPLLRHMQLRHSNKRRCFPLGRRQADRPRVLAQCGAVHAADTRGAAIRSRALPMQGRLQDITHLEPEGFTRCYRRVHIYQFLNLASLLTVGIIIVFSTVNFTSFQHFLLLCLAGAKYVFTKKYSILFGLKYPPKFVHVKHQIASDYAHEVR